VPILADECTPEDAAELHEVLKNCDSKRSGKQPICQREARDDEIEDAIIQALAPTDVVVDCTSTSIYVVTRLGYVLTRLAIAA